MYYLSSSVETVVSLATQGELPSKLPSYMKISDIVCTKFPSQSVLEGMKTLDQVFIMAIELNPVDGKVDPSVVVPKIDVSKIKHIIAYSQRGFNLLKNLFKGECPFEVIIEPFAYPSRAPVSDKRERDEEKKTSSSSSIAPPKITAMSSSSSSAPVRMKPAPIHGCVEVRRISTALDHINQLKFAFHNAKRTLLITSFSINQSTFERAGLNQLLPAAVARGVRIYIYFNDKKEITAEIEAFLKKNQVIFDCAYTHSKILAFDREFVATGSANWLSLVDPRYPESDEGTFIFRGDICKDLIDDFWEYIRHYRNIQFGNHYAVNDFEDDSENESTLIYELEDKSTVGYLPTLEQHLGFLTESFEKAKKRVILCSPFISTAEQYKEDIDDELLKQVIARGVSVYFVCSGSSPALKEFEQFIAGLNSPNVYLIVVNHFHLKTIIVDDHLIGEGSFNWLSASRDDESDFHNHEQTLFVEGAKAKELIENFFSSRTGLIVSTEMADPQNSSSHIALKQREQQNSAKDQNESKQQKSCIIIL